MMATFPRRELSMTKRWGKGWGRGGEMCGNMCWRWRAPSLHIGSAGHLPTKSNQPTWQPTPKLQYSVFSYASECCPSHSEQVASLFRLSGDVCKHCRGGK